MRLLILCVDGFDPDYAEAQTFNILKYRSKLEIPRECFIETPDGPQPSTGLVWISIFSGRLSQGRVERTGLRKYAHDLLMRHGITWGSKLEFTVNPWNRKEETVFTDKLAFTWNLPTISPEWILSFPDIEELVNYSRREYQIFLMLARALLKSPHDLGCLYTRIVDVWGHVYDRKRLDEIYQDVTIAIHNLRHLHAQGPEIMVISDHGCLDGVHTDHAFAGATFPFEAKNILDLREVIESRLS